MAKITKIRRLLRKFHRATRREATHMSAVSAFDYEDPSREEMLQKATTAGLWKHLWWGMIESHAEALLNGSVSL